MYFPIMLIASFEPEQGIRVLSNKTSSDETRGNAYAALVA